MANFTNKEEVGKLRKLGAERKKLRERISEITKEARVIIGFEIPEDFDIDDSDDFCKAAEIADREIENIFVEYAEITRSRWKVESLCAEILSITDGTDIDPVATLDSVIKETEEEP